VLRKVSLVFLVMAAPGWYQQVSSPAAEAARRDDVYSIYSVLMTNPPIAIRGISESTLMIAGQTPRQRSANDLQQCMTLPAEYQSSWSELLMEINRNGNAVETIEPRLKISKRYLVLTPEEVADFMFNRGRRPEYQKPLDPKFQGATQLYFLGKVYFNHDRTLAVTTISVGCGSLCGVSGWRVFEKKPGFDWYLMERRAAGSIACGDSRA
jgi:hypothetical protein